MSKTYPEVNTMTERAILDELQAIAILPPEEMTVGDARRSASLRDYLEIIANARRPVGPDAPLTNALGEG